MQGPVFERHGYDAATTVGCSLHDVIPASSWDRLGHHWGAALTGQSHTVDSESSDGHRDYWLHFSPLQTKAGVVGAILIAQDISDRTLGREEMAHRLTQQAAVSSLGTLALQGRNLSELFDAAARVLHGALASDVVMVLETSEDGDISVRASAGEAPPQPPEPSPHVRRKIGDMRAAGADAAHDRARRDHGARPRARGRGHGQPGGRARRGGSHRVRGARRLQPPQRGLLRGRPRLRRVDRERADGHGRAGSRRDRARQRAGARDASRGAAQRRAAARADRQLGHRLRDRLAHALGEPAGDARDGRLRVLGQHLLRAHPSRGPQADAGAHGHLARGQRDERAPRPAARRPRADVRLGLPLDPRRGRHARRAARHGQGRHGGPARRGGPQPLRGALPPGLRQRADRDVARRPADHALRARQRRLLHDGRQAAGGAAQALAGRHQPSRGPARHRQEPAAAHERRRGAARHREALPAPRRHRGLGVGEHHAGARAATARSTCCSGRWWTSPSARRARRR